MASTRTRARPAGREQRAVATKKDEPITAAESGADGEKPKRGRGRPPKNGVSKVVKVPSGRPRGRPPKDPSQKVTPKPKPAGTGTGRRGRPRKSDAAATPSKSATPNKATSASKPTGSAKSRAGRKRKSDAIDEPDAEENSGSDGQEDASGEKAPLEDEDVEVDTGAEADIEAGAALDDEEVPAVTGDINSEDDAASPEDE